MTVIVTRNAPDRIRGFLASCMCEIGPGIYAAPRMNAGIRDRVWSVIESWFRGFDEEAILMTWPDRSLPGGQNVRTLGIPRKTLIEHHGVFLAMRSLTDDEQRSLTTELKRGAGSGHQTDSTEVESSS